MYHHDDNAARNVVCRGALARNNILVEFPVDIIPCPNGDPNHGQVREGVAASTVPKILEIDFETMAFGSGKEACELFQNGHATSTTVESMRLLLTRPGMMQRGPGWGIADQGGTVEPCSL